jgi:hypothetical protein
MPGVQYENLYFRGYPERTSGIECGSGFQPRQLNSRLEAAPTESLSNSNLDFPDKRVFFFSKIFKIDEFVKSRIHQVFGVSCLVFGMK